MLTVLVSNKASLLGLPRLPAHCVLHGNSRAPGVSVGPNVVVGSSQVGPGPTVTASFCLNRLFKGSGSQHSHTLRCLGSGLPHMHLRCPVGFTVILNQGTQAPRHQTEAYNRMSEVSVPFLRVSLWFKLQGRG